MEGWGLLVLFLGLGLSIAPSVSIFLPTPLDLCRHFQKKIIDLLVQSSVSLVHKSVSQQHLHTDEAPPVLH